MSGIQSIRADIQEHVPDILGRFHKIVEEDEPWLLLPEARRMDHFGEMILQLSEVALGEDRDEERLRQMLHTAARHGTERLEAGFPEALVFRELYLLRQALWGYLSEKPDGCGPLGFEAIVRVDGALSLATKASLRGFHRPTFESRERWPACIDEMVTHWGTLPRVG